MQAAISTVAHWLERMVSTLPMSGSMAALARWNSRMQQPNTSSGALAEQAAQIHRRLAGAQLRQVAVRALGIDLRRGDAAQHEQRRDEQRRGDEEHRLGGEEVAEAAHHRRRQRRADRGEARVAAEALADRGMADEARG